MTSPYRVEAVIGSYSLASQDGDPAAYGLADPVQISCAMPNSDVAPLVQKLPDEAIVNVIAPDATTYNFRLGDQVRVTIYAHHSGGNNYAFFGRVALLEAQPHDLGILYTLSCVDYLADLTELKAGRVDYPAETCQARINRMLAENGIGPVLVEGVAPSVNPNVSARVNATEGVVSLTEAIEEVLAGWPESQVNNELGVASLNVITTRYELRANIINPGGVVGQGQLDPATPYKLTPIYRPQGWDPPARFSTTPDAHLTFSTANSSPSTEALILDAGHVDFAPKYVQQKGNAITRVVVQLDGVGYSLADWTSWGVYTYLSSAAALEATVKTRTTQTGYGSVLSSMYRGQIQPDPGVSWVVGELSWRASRTQASGWQGPKLRRVCTVARVDAVRTSSHVPTGKSWIAGVVDSLRIVVASGEVIVYFTLAPMHYTTTGPGVVPHQATYAAASLVGVTFAQLHPTDTFADYLLLYA